MYQPISPYVYYSSSTWIADNLRIPDNGHSSLHEVIQYYTKNVPTNGRQWVRLTLPTTFLHAVHGIINNLYKNKTAIHVDTLKNGSTFCLAIVMTTATALLAQIASS